MSAKLDKIGAERERARQKRDEWDARFQELDKKYVEQEKTEIHEMVHAADLTPDQLAEIIRLAQTQVPNPENLPGNAQPEAEVNAEREDA